MTAIFFSALRADSSALRVSTRCRRQREIPVPGQIQYPGYATELTCCMRKVTKIITLPI